MCVFPAHLMMGRWMGTNPSQLKWQFCCWCEQDPIARLCQTVLSWSLCFPGSKCLSVAFSEDVFLLQSCVFSYMSWRKIPGPGGTAVLLTGRKHSARPALGLYDSEAVSVFNPDVCISLAHWLSRASPGKAHATPVSLMMSYWALRDSPNFCCFRF